MCHECLGCCCEAVFLCLAELCQGVCLEFWTTRHTCVDNMCACRSSSPEEDAGEQEPLLVQDAEPRPRAAMEK
ncbi:hypothetical protein OH77DRAFT_1399834 [Trametes cingulata]|nr:hypothetical protein OH77DRAFT_1399834 [Trametes cingulata]